MSDKFHRFTTPSYTGAPSIPNPAPGTVTFNGVVYDYINVIPSGTGSSGSAFADGEKTGGPNAGTYWVAFGEDVTSSDANRGMRALAENCDTLDDRFHQDIAYSVLPPYVTAVGSVSSIILLGPGVFVGDNPSYPIAMLFEIVDDLNREIFDESTGQKIVVTSISGASIGDGFSTGNITLTLNHAIPNGQTYAVWYGSRTNLSTLPVDALNFHRIRTANEVDAEVEFLFSNIQGPSAQDIPWNQTPTTTTLFDAAASGLNERYNRQTSVTVPVVPPEPFWSTNVITGTYYPSGTPTTTSAPGGGGWFVRTGPAITGYSADNGAYTDPINSVFNAKFFDTPAGGGSGGAVGFGVYGSRHTGASFTGEGRTLPGAASFLHLWPHDFLTTMNTTTPYTRIVDGATATFLQVGAFNADSGESIVEVTAANNYFRNGSSQSSINLGYDLLECTYTVGGVTLYQTFVIVGHGSSVLSSDPTKVRVRNLDGTCPNFSTVPTGTIRWTSTTFVVGDGAGAYHNAVHTDTDPVLLDGLFYQVPPRLSSTIGDDNVARNPPSFSAQANVFSAVALQWGGFQHGTPYGPSFNGFLNGDGGLQAGGVATFLANVNYGPVSGSSSISFNGNTSAFVDGSWQFSGGSSLTVGTGATFVIQTGVSFGPGTFQVGGLFTNAEIELYGDASNSGTLLGQPGSTVHVSGKFLFDGVGSTGAINNDATFGSSSNVFLEGSTFFGVGSTAVFEGVSQFSNPISMTATPVANSVYGNNIIKSQASAMTNGSGGFTSQDGFNATLSLPGSSHIQVVFQTSISQPYVLKFQYQYVSGSPNKIYFPIEVSRSSTGFIVEIYDFRNDLVIDPQTVGGLTFGFDVVGRQ